MNDHKAKSSTKHLVVLVASWLITCVALYIAFKGIAWSILFAHLREANAAWIALAVGLTCGSYLLRSFRWQHLFPRPVISFANSAKVLILGFFMNNVLPARTGELVRAHLGAKVTGETRTLVLATVASERLADGLTLSLLFVGFASGLGDTRFSRNLFYVSSVFGLAAVGVLLTLVLREPIFRLADKFRSKLNHKASDYTIHRIQVFINGLAPLFNRRHLLPIVLWSLVIWLVELCVYFAITRAFSSNLSLSGCVLFLVAVNFSSLIPAAPGGLGVIEAVASAALISIGVEKEHALSMVIVQHVIQYAVVGIPGALLMLRWGKTIKHLEDSDEQSAGQSALS
jgi:uncharacterized protein (TIRG00374 family)